MADFDDSFSEMYFQISPQILECFPKYRPPLNLYRFKDSVGDLEPFFYVGNRLSKEAQQELAELCQAGLIFVARSDHPVYAEHISEQLDLILMDTNLKESEIAEIISLGLVKHIGSFYEQPVKPSLEQLTGDLLVLTEYLAQDPFRRKALIRRLSRDDSLAAVAYATVIIGLATYLQAHGNRPNRKHFDRLALGLAATNLGLSKVPQYIRDKGRNLSAEEERKLRQYPTAGAKILHKLDVREEMTVSVVQQHRERLDGSGFPRQLRGDDLEEAARIGALAYAFSNTYCRSEEGRGADMQQVSTLLTKKQTLFDYRLAALLHKSVTEAFEHMASAQPDQS
jgi:HD-GYP domain-containing protein (c-di-GMP phosphodiesterase class II)